jgi:hypothetical protein
MVLVELDMRFCVFARFDGSCCRGDEWLSLASEHEGVSEVLEERCSRFE